MDAVTAAMNGTARTVRSHGAATLKAAAAILCLLAGGLLTAGCGGGSTGTMGNQPPPPPVFTEIEGTGAGPGGTSALDINASGNVVGTFKDMAGVSHGFLLSEFGLVTVFDAPSAGTAGLGTEPEAINASNMFAGTFTDMQGINHGFLHTPEAVFTTIDGPNTTSTSIVALNDSGQAAGEYAGTVNPVGFVRETDGTLTTFSVGPGLLETFAVERINASGTVVGFFTDSNRNFHGFLFTDSANGGLTVIDAPNDTSLGGAGTAPFDINASGEVVGIVVTGLTSPVLTGHSFLMEPTGSFAMFDPPVTGIRSSQANAINDSGTIVGTYVGPDGVQHGYARSPAGTFVTFDEPDAAQLAVSNLNVGTVPARINAGGTIMGNYSDAAGVRHGFIVTNLVPSP